MKIGFSGSRLGLTDAQRGTFGTLIVFDYRPTELHHGSCQGADVEAARLVRHVHANRRIIAHPGPVGNSHYEASGVDDETCQNDEFLSRNRTIANSTELLIATPAEMSEQQRGGTWSTVRYAMKVKKPVVIVFPDGSSAKWRSVSEDELFPKS